MIELKEKYKIPLISFLLAFALFLIYYFHVVIGTGVIFTHFFYVPVVLAAIWWRKKGLIIAVVLALALMISDLFVVKKEFIFISNDFVRSCMLIVVSYLVVTLSEIILKHELRLKKTYDELEIHIQERTAELSESNILLKQEILARKQAQEELYLSLQSQGILNKLLKISLENIPLEEMLEKSLDQIISIPWLNFESKGAFFLVEDNAQELKLKAHRGMSKYFEALCNRVPYGRCLCGRAASLREVIFADSVDDERHENRYKDMAPHGHLCVPIISLNQKILGVLNLYLKSGYKRNESEIEFLQLVANLLAGMIERKYVEEVLRESEERFRGAFEGAAIGIALVSSDGRWLKVNRSLCNIVGYTAEELLTKTFQDITYPEDLHADLEYVHKMLVGEISYYHLEKRYIHKQGNIVWIFLSVSLVRDKQGKPLHFVSQVEDITERKKAEEALYKAREELEVRVQKRTHELARINVQLQEEILERRKIENSLQESEEHYHRIISKITDYIYTVYVEKSGVVKTVHRPGCFAVTGYSQKEFHIDPYLWIHMVPEEERQLVSDWSESILEGENVKPLEHRIIRKDKTIRWISNTPVLNYNNEGELISYDGAVKDITERKNAEEKINLMVRDLEKELAKWKKEG